MQYIRRSMCTPKINLFEEQERVANNRSRKSMKWQPLMICWCLYLRHMSGKGYRKTTSPVTKDPHAGITPITTAPRMASAQKRTCKVILERVSNCEEHEKLMSIIIDEMYIY